MTILHECSEIEIIVADITKTEKNREFRNISREVDENVQRVNIFINNLNLRAQVKNFNYCSLKVEA